MKVRQTWIALSLLLAVIASAPTAVVSQDVGPASGSEFSTNPNGRNPRTNGNPPDVGPASGSSTSTNPNGRPSRPETNGGGGQDPGPASGGSSSSTNPNGRGPMTGDNNNNSNSPTPGLPPSSGGDSSTNPNSRPKPASPSPSPASSPATSSPSSAPATFAPSPSSTQAQAPTSAPSTPSSPTTPSATATTQPSATRTPTTASPTATKTPGSSIDFSLINSDASKGSDIVGEVSAEEDASLLEKKNATSSHASDEESGRVPGASSAAADAPARYGTQSPGSTRRPAKNATSGAHPLGGRGAPAAVSALVATAISVALSLTWTLW
ncbi:hypothetical protein ATCC90586_003668 [Pythium insidiosum]|nr:hypothetical protein ATCC90586_003668 [Pythium insidiosum]